MGKSLSRLRLNAFRRQAGRCYYCTAPMWHNDHRAFAQATGLSLRASRWLQCTAEHLKPKSDSGLDSRENIVAACRICNMRRHSRRKVAPTPEKYQTLVRNRVSQKRWHVSQVFERGLVNTLR
jgi:5-methylcytosine-specific restriction endonuclease McrA